MRRKFVASVDEVYFAKASGSRARMSGRLLDHIIECKLTGIDAYNTAL